MIGWHYTSQEAWQKIQVQGLRPRALDAPNNYSDAHEAWQRVRAITGAPEGIQGIWVWKHKPVGDSQLGNIILTALKSPCKVVVALQVAYTEADILVLNEFGDTVTLRHRGVLINWCYHRAEPAEVLGRAIPCSQIHVVGEYDIRNAATGSTTE